MQPCISSEGSSQGQDSGLPNVQPGNEDLGRQGRILHQALDGHGETQEGVPRLSHGQHCLLHPRSAILKDWIVQSCRILWIACEVHLLHLHQWKHQVQKVQALGHMPLVETSCHKLLADMKMPVKGGLEIFQPLLRGQLSCFELPDLRVKLSDADATKRKHVLRAWLGGVCVAATARLEGGTPNASHCSFCLLCRCLPWSCFNSRHGFLQCCYGW
mmetsp:Transcript_46524/g.109006  ORF Transcript_46524/g.109006 Transcript_46524/m.109006 type:complete len:215 (+) Transcript_46524:407-1051(+)